MKFKEFITDPYVGLYIITIMMGVSIFMTRG